MGLRALVRKVGGVVMELEGACQSPVNWPIRRSSNVAMLCRREGGPSKR